MSCDLSDSAISESYKKILNREISWFVLGYGDSREKLFLYSSGMGSIKELKEHLVEPIHYALLLYQDHLIYILYVDENLSGVRKARTVVHGRAVAAYFEQLDVSLHITNLENLTEEVIKSQIEAKSIAMEEESALPKSNEQELITPSTEPIAGTYPSETVLSAGDHVENIAENQVDTNESSIFFNPNSVAFNQSTPVLEEEATLPPEPEIKVNLEQEAKRKIQEAWEKRQSVRIQFSNLGEEETSQTMDYITVQGDGSYFWKRRWYVLRGETLYFYRDPMEKFPISCLDLGDGTTKVEDCSLETLIPHSFKLILEKSKGKEEYLFFADSKPQMDQAILAIKSGVCY